MHGQETTSLKVSLFAHTQPAGPLSHNARTGKIENCKLSQIEEYLCPSKNYQFTHEKIILFTFQNKTVVVPLKTDGGYQQPLINSTLLYFSCTMQFHTRKQQSNKFTPDSEFRLINI